MSWSRDDSSRPHQDVGMRDSGREASQHEDEYENDLSNADDNSSEPEERPGRFLGPDSTWRHYTEEERALAASLDQAEHNDLSLHLYNAHTWKQQHRDSTLSADSKTWLSKQRWIKRDKDGKLPFLPHAGWTAWPLDPADVPRRSEQWGVPLQPDDTPGLYSNPEPWKPSLDLYEELKAIILRNAVQRFRQREWVIESPVPERVSEKLKLDGMDLERADRGSTANQTPEAVTDFDIGVGNENSTHKLRQSGLSAWESDISFLDDDEIAGTILQQTVRGIVSKLDDLLSGLHESRQGHRQERSPSVSRSQTPESRSRSRVGRLRHASTPSKRKRRTASAAAETSDFENDSAPREHLNSGDSLPRHQDLRRGQHGLGVRDWSEVLGVAAIIGWDPAVIDRATRKCAALFGETMSMRVMAETNAETECDRIIDYHPETIPPLDFQSESSADPSETDDEASDDLSCPYAECGRHVVPFLSISRLRQHLRKKHRHTVRKADLDSPTTSSPKQEISSNMDDSEPDHHSDAKEVHESQGHSIATSAVRKDGFLQQIILAKGTPKASLASPAKDQSGQQSPQGGKNLQTAEG